LAARDAADLGVISSILQDALVPLSDMAWLRDERRFVMAVNRFRWERGESARGGERVAAGVSFENVDRVRRRALERGRRGGFLSLLSVSLGEGAAGSGAAVDLTFAGNAAIRLETTSLLCHLEDFGEPWPAQWRPDHSKT
jgi:hypothetical protein